MDSAWQDASYWLPMVVAAGLSLLLAGYAWGQRDMRGALAFAALMVSVAWWAGAYAVELGADDLPLKLMAARVKYAGIVLAAPAWFVFTLQSIGLGGWLTRPRLAAFAVPSILTLLAVWTNDAHHLYWRTVAVHDDGPALALAEGPLFWAAVAWNYGLLAAGTGLLLRLARRGLFREEATVVLAGAALPWLGNVLFLARLTPIPHVDLAPFAFSLAGLLYGRSLLRRRLLDIATVARNTVVEQLHDGVVVLDAHGRVVDLNPAAGRGLGRAPGSPPPVGWHAARLHPALAAHTPHQTDSVVDTRVDIPRDDGETARFGLRSTPLFRAGRFAGRVITLRDVTERARWEARLLHQALHDPLTGLPNRTLLFDRLDQAIRAADRPLSDGRREKVACLVFDLDGFKRVNDDLGHRAGDDLLRRLADLSGTVIRAGDTFARLGGDEFAILLPDTDRHGASAVARKLLDALHRPAGAGDRYDRHPVGASLGIAVYPDDADTPETLIARADAAMYIAKRGRTGYAVAGEPAPSADGDAAD